ncbi:RHS repeat-associated core domain-containing protein [Salmonella enterica]|uniref:RHS repeat-associated core domain-containing protein n=1 Tax=Salmonella enterica TaxID=28901 RepID=UPI0009735E1D|nr:RHS repeat-associated core domain-containing protein [Salmonella enterica]EAC1192471.1 RHS repeat protein [Salmonella enterica subsp. enterica serovar Heidelberg]EAW1335724.1 RHS repeat protein [Salmonella enterica subsp. enterica]APY49025.1 type IV secretion protein Rhs [Salmonella enterica subsp. enterica serovar Crossness str. 1422-74]EAW1716624.1 RHS repeat family protein [Salmonella enterica subsp. enterica]EAW1775972.1 RHS repeat family protein [Salmonella enterica subsp. enterica]
MGEAFWAAREGDALLHTSFLADLVGSALEFAINAVIDFAALAVVALATGATVATLGCSAVLLVGTVVGATMLLSGAGEKISKACEDIANSLFPPKIEGYILTGSGDTRINSKRAARAAATALSRHDVETLDAQAQAEAEEEKRRQDAKSMWDVAGEYLDAVKGRAENMAKGVVSVVSRMGSAEGWASLGNDALAEAGDMLSDTGHFISEMWQPTVATAYPGSDPKQDDKIDCHKHPSSFTQFMAQKLQALTDDPVGTVLGAMNTFDVLEAGFQAASALIGSVSNLFKGDDEPPAAEYIAEGTRDVRINSQPAARSGVRCTCEAKVVDEPENGVHVSGDVRIGGPLLVVRDIKSGKSQITLVTTIALTFMQPGRASAKSACFMMGLGINMMVQKAGSALNRPVNAATGAKYLAGDDDVDFSLPGHFPLEWQRTYSSRDERTEGMFGRGWSVLYEVCLERTPDNPDENCMTYVSPMGRRIDLQAVEPGSGFYSPGEGLAVRRSEQGHWLISSDDGVYRLFEADPFSPQRRRLKMLGDRNSNCQHLTYDNHGRLVEISGDRQRPCIRLHYELAAHPQRVTRIFRHYPEGEPELLRRYRYDEAGRLNGVVDNAGQYQREFAYDDNDCMTMHREPGGERYYYSWAWFEGPDDAAWRVTGHHTDSGEQYRLDWNLAERSLCVTDSLGRTRCHWWDAQGLVTAYRDEAGQMTTLTNENGESYRFRYDVLDRVTEQTDPGGSRRAYGYNALNAVTAVIYGGERGGEIRHGLERDAAGRLTVKITPETRTEYRYDAADRLLEIRRRQHDAAEGGEPEVIRFSYDSAGNLLSEETAQGVLQNRYDVQGNRTETQMPDGRTLRYLYYGSGHLQQINLGRDVISEFTRDHLHREVQRSQGRLDTRRMYDRTGRLTRKLTCKGMRGVVPETFIDREYAYSGQDELLKKRHSRQGVTDYFYDTTGRITACRNEAYLDSWQYDAAANLLDRRQGETAQAGAGSVVPFNRITSYRGLHYRYDEYGRVVEKRGRNGTQHYRWDAEHRLTEVAVIRGSTVRRYGYVYDAPGRRVEKHELDAEGKPYNRTTFLWDGMRLAQECRLGRSSSLYIYSDQGSHEPLARVDRAAPGEADEVLYYHTDVNGAPEEMTDGGGNIVWEAGYQVWGNLTHEKETRPVQQNLRFQGQYLDRETGLHYNLYRFYDPDIGKFISGDPISLRGGINLYAYAQNPLSWIDPLGLTGEWVNPKDINFSQRTISPHDYAEIMRNGGWDWDRSPLRVIDIDGQLVSYDNRRLDAALEAGLDKVKVIRIDPNAPHPDSSTGKTWLQKFRERFRDRRNIKAGGIVPDKGLNSRPERTSRGCK